MTQPTRTRRRTDDREDEAATRDLASRERARADRDAVRGGSVLVALLQIARSMSALRCYA